MGYAFCTGTCLVCHRLFSFNPVKVPSFRYKGKKEPICESCLEMVNQKRKEMGLSPFIPERDAYTYCREEELG